VSDAAATINAARLSAADAGAAAFPAAALSAPVAAAIVVLDLVLPLAAVVELPEPVVAVVAVLVIVLSARAALDNAGTASQLPRRNTSLPAWSSDSLLRFTVTVRPAVEHTLSEEADDADMHRSLRASSLSRGSCLQWRAHYSIGSHAGDGISSSNCPVANVFVRNQDQPWTIATVTALCPYVMTKERLCLLKQGCQVASTLSNQAAHQIITMMPVVMAKVAMIATNL
jgi:hypothetical protein